MPLNSTHLHSGASSYNQELNKSKKIGRFSSKYFIPYLYRIAVKNSFQQVLK